MAINKKKFVHGQAKRQLSSSDDTKKKTTLLPATVFSFLERDFANIILEIQDGDLNGRPSTMQWNRKTIIFQNGTKLYATEHLENGLIDFYYYDWVTNEGEEILKWHSESHDKDKRYQTATEPFHIHLPKHEILHSMYRLANHEHKSLRSIIELILLFDKITSAFGGTFPNNQK